MDQEQNSEVSRHHTRTQCASDTAIDRVVFYSPLPSLIACVCVCVCVVCSSCVRSLARCSSRFACEIVVEPSTKGMTVVIPDYPDRDVN